MILVCGDSYNIDDYRYPDLHWTTQLKKVPNIEIANLSRGGASNQNIFNQVCNGLLNLDVKFVVLNCTATARLETLKQNSMSLKNYLDSNINSMQSDSDRINVFNYDTFLVHNSNYNAHEVKWFLKNYDNDIDYLHNIAQITATMSLLHKKNIPFCFDNGLMAMDTTEQICTYYGIINPFNEFKENKIDFNLSNFGRLLNPWFHVDDPQVHKDYANTILKRLQHFIKTETK